MKHKYTTAAELVASVNTLLTLPEVYLQVKAVVEDPDSCLSDLVNAVSVDPGITARLLRLANSSYFNVIMPVTNIRQAANLLGMNPIHDLVLATTLTSVFSKFSNQYLDMQKFWQDSICCAVLSSLLATKCGEKDHESLFTGGLLSNIGHQIMYRQMASEASAALQASQTTGKALATVERELIGYSYADVGGELMLNWNMPDKLCDMVRYHTNPDLSEHYGKPALLVHIANELTQFREQNPDTGQLHKLINPVVWATTEMTPDDVLALFADANMQIKETTNTLFSNGAAA